MQITSNAKALAAMIRSYGRNLPQATRRGMDIWARRTSAAVKAAAPRGKTRNLRRSISGRGVIHAGRPVALLFARAKEAIFCEFGTGIHGPRRRPFMVMPRRRKALRWIAGGGKGAARGYAFSKGHMVNGMRPRPFFFPVIRRNLSALPGYVVQAIRRQPRR